MKISLLLSLVMLSSLASAQTLTLDDAVQKAIATHPDIKRFVLQVDKSRSGVSVARSDYLPQVNLYGEYDPTKTYVFPSNGVFHTKESDGWLASASLHQKIWDFSKTTANIDAQKESIEVAKLSLADAKALLAYKVKLQYELIALQRDAMKVREKDLQAKKALYKQAEALVKQGMKTSADASRFLSSLYIAQDNLAIAKASFDKARNTLGIYINEKIEEDVILDDAKVNLVVSDTETILKSSPSLQALEKNIQKNALTYKSVQSSHYGSVDAVASYSCISSLNEYDSSVVGITLNIPLYSGGRTSAFVEEAELNRQSAQEEYNSKALALKEDVEATIIDIKRYKQTIKAKRAQLESVSQTSKILEARYKEGLATYIEVLDATSLQLNAKLGLLSAEYERSSAIHKLEYLQGKTE